MSRTTTRLSQIPPPLNIQNYESLIDNNKKDNASEGKDTPILINKIVKVNTPDEFHGDKRKLEVFLI